jgi:hypothetical protein
VRAHAPAAQHLRRLPQVGHRPVRAVADVDLVDPLPDGLVERDDVPGRVRHRDERRQRVQVDADGLRELGIGVRPFGGPGPVGPPLEVLRNGVVGREEARLGPRLDRHVRDCEALVDREPLGPVADELERHVRPSCDADLADHREEQVLPVANRCCSPVKSTRIVPGTACQKVPEARHAAMSVEPRPVRNAPSAVPAGVRVAAGDHRPRHYPAILDEGVCSIPPRPCS